MKDLNLGPEEQKLLAKTFWNVAFGAAIKACREDGIPATIVFVAMIETMTSVLQSIMSDEGE